MFRLPLGLCAGGNRPDAPAPLPPNTPRSRSDSSRYSHSQVFLPVRVRFLRPAGGVEEVLRRAVMLGVRPVQALPNVPVVAGLLHPTGSLRVLLPFSG